MWYRSGPDNIGPDALSCRPIGINLMTAHKVIRISTKQMQQETARDETIQLVLSYVRSGFPATRSQLPQNTHGFWNARAHLREKDSMLFFDNRVVIPTSLRKEILDRLHMAHQGVTGMILWAQKSFFWPGIQSDIQRKRDSCISCMESVPSHSYMPAHPPTRPEYPFQSICIDYCHYAGHRYIYNVLFQRFCFT